MGNRSDARIERPNAPSDDSRRAPRFSFAFRPSPPRLSVSLVDAERSSASASGRDRRQSERNRRRAGSFRSADNVRVPYAWIALRRGLVRTFVDPELPNARAVRLAVAPRSFAAPPPENRTGGRQEQRDGFDAGRRAQVEAPATMRVTRRVRPTAKDRRTRSDDAARSRRHRDGVAMKSSPSVRRARPASAA